MRIIWRALLSFGPLVAVAAGFVVVGEYATEFPGSARVPDLGLLRGGSSPLESRVEFIPVQGTEGGDVIVVTRDRDGMLAVTVNGWRRDYSAGVGRPLAVYGRGGDDLVRVAGDVHAGLALSGGEGDDLLVGGAGDDLIVGGDGDDDVQAGHGDDVVDAGGGDDVVRLGAGRDGADGGEGRDWLAGGDGDDYLQGGRGRDALSGGHGGDVLYGLAGRDHLAGGSGADYLDGGTGDDDVAGDGGRDIDVGGIGGDVLRDVAGGDLLVGGAGRDSHLTGDGSRVVPYPKREGPPARRAVEIGDDRYGFAARVQSDLDALRSVPLGRELLDRLDASGRTVEVRPTDGGNAITFDAIADGYVRTDGRPGPGTSSRVHYNPYRTAVGDGKRAWQRRPPIVGLFHELVHALAAADGKLLPDDDDQQLQAIGVAADDVADLDGHGMGSALGGAAQALPTENAFRAFLGLPPRP